MNENLEYVRQQAKIQAQLTKQNQVVYATYYKNFKTYRFKPESDFRGAVVEVIRYTPEDKRRDVLPDNGNRKPDVVGGKPKEIKRKTTGKVKRDTE